MVQAIEEENSLEEITQLADHIRESASYLCQASKDISRIASRTSASAISARPILWLREWQGDSETKKAVESIPFGGMSRDKRPRVPPSPHSSEETWDSVEECDPIQEVYMASQQRTSRDPRHQRKKSKKRTTRQPTSRPEQPSEEEASADESGKKNPRGPRYSGAENCALVEGVDRSYEVLYGSKAQKTASKQKRKIWDAITEKVNAVSGNHRDNRNCMKRYSDCGRQTRKKMGMQRRHEMGTGGGPELNIRWLPWEEMIKRRMNSIVVQGTPGIVGSALRAAIPEEEEPLRRTKKSAGPQISGPQRARVVSSRRPSLLSTREKESTRSKPHDTQELPAPDTEESMTLDPQAIPRLLESSCVTDNTLKGFKARHSERSSVTSRRLSGKVLEPQDEGEKMPQSQSSTRALTGIRHYFRPNLRQEESDEEDMDVQPAVSTPLASQIRLVGDFQQWQDPSIVQRLQNLIAEIHQRQDSFRDVVNTRLENIEKTVERMANSLAEIEKGKGAPEIEKNRQEDQMTTMEILNILTTSMRKLEENKTCLYNSLRDMCESQRQIAASSILIANVLKFISEKLPWTAQYGTLPPPPPPPPAEQTPYAFAPAGPWYGQSPWYGPQYQGYPKMYPMFQQHPPSTMTPASVAAASSAAPRPPQRHKAPRRTPPRQDPEEEEDDQGTID
ncbi:uncharacterized protein LOC134983084 [Pseudophryne corroboree]|uniref:uncharacterized protein LOC134983084 n=1 Tax=Pseudophryne corroboree TaxID=495146 RepID=UPI003081ADB6